MNTQHTPGPWEVLEGHSGQFIFYGENRNMVASICQITNEESLANAHLIAAAPDLLEACIEALSLFDNYPECYKAIGTFQVLNNAIAKAKGQS